MSALLDVQPTAIEKTMVTFGNICLVGGYITCVFPPTGLLGWRAVRFYVQSLQAYDKVNERPLTDDEVAHFAALMAQAVVPMFAPIEFD